MVARIILLSFKSYKFVISWVQNPGSLSMRLQLVKALNRKSVSNEVTRARDVENGTIIMFVRLE